MSDGASKDPLHGKTLKVILEELVERYGWEDMSSRISINCFAVNPSIASSLSFLRRTPWARNKVENLYLLTHGHKELVRQRVEAAASKREAAESKKPATKPRSGPRAATGKSGIKRVEKSAKPKVNPWTGKTY